MENDNISTLSPVKPKEIQEEGVVLLNFGQAIEIVLVGKHVHKLEWKEKDYYALLDKGVLKLHKPDGQLYQWIISDADLSGTDYTVL